MNDYGENGNKLTEQILYMFSTKYIKYQRHQKALVWSEGLTNSSTHVI